MYKLIVALFAALALAAAAAQPTVDGVIGADEYANTFADDHGLTLYWTVDGDDLHMAFTIEARGWAGIGWGAEQTNRKAGFDVLIVTEQGGEFVLLDMFQESARGEPVLDTDEGGSNAFSDYAISRDGDMWTVEFVRPLDTGETTDVAIVPGESMILMGAFSNVMDVSRAHARSTQGGAWYIEDFAF